MRHFALAVIAGVLAVWLYLLPWGSLVAQLIILTGVFIFVRIARRREWDWMGADWRVVIIFAAAFLFITPRLWLPAEQIETTERGTLVAYVLKVDKHWTTMMLEETRGILILRSKLIETRTVCNLPDEVTSGRSFYQLMLGEPGGPANPACQVSSPGDA